MIPHRLAGLSGEGEIFAAACGETRDFRSMKELIQ